MTLEETSLEAARLRLQIAEEEASRKDAEQERRMHEQEALKESDRRRKNITEELKAALAQYRLAIVVGAGITMGATSDEQWNNPQPRTTWKGLIMNGVDYLVQEKYFQESDTTIQMARELLRKGDLQSVLSAATFTKTQLSNRGKYATWLTAVFHNLHDEVSMNHKAIYETLGALQKQGAILLTTNYDHLLEHFCSLESISRLSITHLLELRRGTRKGIFHIHGSYREPGEVVLDTTDYFAIKQSAEVQNYLQSLVDDKTILFVGCGSGLEDPNFHSLLKWAGERHKNLPHAHYLMLRDEDLHDHKSLSPVRYGPSYRDLVPYLNRLLGASSQATSSDSRASRAQGE